MQASCSGLRYVVFLILKASGNCGLYTTTTVLLVVNILTQTAINPRQTILKCEGPLESDHGVILISPLGLELWA